MLAQHTAVRLERAIANNMVIARRILPMGSLGRELPEPPTEPVFPNIALNRLPPRPPSSPP